MKVAQLHTISYKNCMDCMKLYGLYIQLPSEFAWIMRNFLTILRWQQKVVKGLFLMKNSLKGFYFYDDCESLRDVTHFAYKLNNV